MTSRPGTRAPCVRANSPTMTEGTGSHGNAIASAGSSCSPFIYVAEGSRGFGPASPSCRTWVTGKSATGASTPLEGSTNATAQFDVPRSTPTRYSRDIPLTAAHIELEIPASGAAFFQATQFQRADLRDRRL